MTDLAEELKKNGLNKDKICFDKLGQIELNLHQKAIDNLSRSNISVDNLKELLSNSELKIRFNLDNENKEELTILIEEYILKCSTKYTTHLFVFYAGASNEQFKSSCSIDNIFELSTGNASSRNDKDNKSLLTIYNYFRGVNNKTDKVSSAKKIDIVQYSINTKNIFCMVHRGW